jgi:hypothetical protein
MNYPITGYGIPVHCYICPLQSVAAISGLRGEPESIVPISNPTVMSPVGWDWPQRYRSGRE